MKNTITLLILLILTQGCSLKYGDIALMSKKDVDFTKKYIISGQIIEIYDDDYPFPSFLIAYVDMDKPLHVLVSYDEKADMCYIITTYEPDLRYFLEDLTTRRKDETEQK